VCSFATLEFEKEHTLPRERCEPTADRRFAPPDSQRTVPRASRFD